MSKPDTSREAVVRLRKLVAMCGDDADIGTLRALLAERDAAIAARDEAIRMMSDASRQAGAWQGISEGKDIALRQLEAERDAARQHVESERDIYAYHRWLAAVVEQATKEGE
jgi:hypothetical protein